MKKSKNTETKKIKRELKIKKEAKIYEDIEQCVAWLYENKFTKIDSEVVFEINFYEDIYQEDIDELMLFHAKKVFMVEKDDEYYCGIRANHFVIEVGYSEMRAGLIYLVTANHKGNRCVTMIAEDNEIYLEICSMK